MKTPQKKVKVLRQRIGKPSHAIVYYTNPRFGGHRELLWLPLGEITPDMARKIQTNTEMYPNGELDSNYPFIRYLFEPKDILKFDKTLWKYLSKLSPKPFTPLTKKK